ncbi:uncharacterized protein NECHADRAFT_102284 [Fusarium vanettenii 77-13-4]|uniref:Zn(2)-C6 fungal-type domain-containing protein n=1 Tax=Fusarium vanettenii (strain ATCC MYA-4622 / CBS 123669 / FGSC 9596 / NRRL 45880 / 77-13-4) TaxID=660122 RepID=C7ZQ81_FUSV7|nr:uncharacterized protein NECHADRAFT_102284 [Fusarium vanettenii 77-13-4]EEU33811.1 hypothetical protein NECHADRAFT_102284 [Fusarium vanettenii 77-13-4]
MQESKPPRRSFNGCERCRKRRQKCGEERPTCKRCRDARASCVYALNVRWGGRSFHLSRFRHCQVQKLAMPSGGFVYSGIRSSSSPDGDDIERRNPEPVLNAPTSLGAPQPSFQQYPDVEPGLLILLDYFVHVASESMCTHQQIRSELCQTLIPMSHTVPSLLSAILSYSASHRVADPLISTHQQDKVLAARLKLESIHRLRNEVDASVTGAQGTLATSLMLLQCVLAHQNDDYNAWRLFLHGARTAMKVITSARPKSGWTAPNPSLRYLQDRYQLFELIAMLPPSGFPASITLMDELPSSPPTSADWLTATSPLTFFLDNYGCSTDVRRLLRGISALAWERRQLNTRSDPNCSSPALNMAELDQKSRTLEAELLCVINRDQQPRPIFSPAVLDILTEEQIFEFITCNQIYEYMLLTFLRKEVIGMATASEEVQGPIREIINLTSLLQPLHGLSPSTGLNTALFIAGRHALPCHQPAIMNHLSAFFSRTLNYNTVRAQDELMKHWSSSSRYSELEPSGDKRCSSARL